VNPLQKRCGSFAAAAGVLLLTLSGCVTERTGGSGWGTGVPVQPLSKAKGSTLAAAENSADAGQSSGVLSGSGKPPPLPTGKVATPKRTNFVATDIQVEVIPLGGITYDGQALPVVSPDGLHIASQEGAAPSWETILAAPGAVVPVGTRIAVYAIVDNKITTVSFASPLPPGLLLSRGSDSQGFLVESPRADGARWVGKVSWATGELTWLVRGTMVNAYATLTPQGELLYCRRPQNVTSASDLVVRGTGGQESVKSGVDGAFCYPVCGASEDVIYVFRVSRVGTDLESIRLDRTKPLAPRPADTRSTWRISTNPEAMLAHQMASTACIPIRGVEMLSTLNPGEVDTVAMFDPRKSRMVRFNVTTGGTQALAAKTVGAVPSVGGLSGRHAMTPGYFVTGPSGLVFLAEPGENPAIPGTGGWPAVWPDDGPSARVLASPYLMRPLRPGTDTAGEPVPRYLLIGPMKGHDDKLELTLMAVVGR